MKDTLQQYTILYAEDETSVQKPTVEYLQRYFKEVYVADNGREALELYKQYSIDVVMLDIDMPYVDGLEVAKKIREENKEIPILIFTAFTDVDKLLKATELNLCKYLVKPVKPTEFKEALFKLGQTLKELNTSCYLLNDGYIWDSIKKILSINDKRIELNHKETLLLDLLVTNKQICVSFESIMAVVWKDGFDTEISIDAVKFHVSQLRKKLPENSIKSVYGKGYIFL